MIGVLIREGTQRHRYRKEEHHRQWRQSCSYKPRNVEDCQ